MLLPVLKIDFAIFFIFIVIIEFAIIVINIKSTIFESFTVVFIVLFIIETN